MAKISFESDKRTWPEKLSHVWASRSVADWMTITHLGIPVEQWKQWEWAMHRPISRAEVINLLTEIFSGNVEVRVK